MMNEYETFTARIAQELSETEDKFIFTTIGPFCSDIYKREISKHELVDAITNYREGYAIYDYTKHKWQCCKCFSYLNNLEGLKIFYCKYCGKKQRRR